MPWKYNSFEWDRRPNAFYLRIYIINDDGLMRTLIFKFSEKIKNPEVVELGRSTVKDINRVERIQEKQKSINKKIQRMIDKGVDPDTIDGLLGSE